MGQWSSSLDDAAQCLDRSQSLSTEHAPNGMTEASLMVSENLRDEKIQALNIAGLKSSLPGQFEPSNSGTVTPNSSSNNEDTSSEGGASWKDASLTPFADTHMSVRHSFLHFEDQSTSAEDARPHRRCRSAPPTQHIQRRCSSKSSNVSEKVYAPRSARMSSKSSNVRVTSDQPMIQASISMPAALPAGVLPVVDVGAEVELRDLEKAPAFNGLTGVVKSWDADTLRYAVLLDAKYGSQWVKVKRENIQPCLPPPPCSMPYVVDDDDDWSEICIECPGTPRWEDSPASLTPLSCSAQSLEWATQALPCPFAQGLPCPVDPMYHHCEYDVAAAVMPPLGMVPDRSMEQMMLSPYDASMYNMWAPDTSVWPQPQAGPLPR